MARFYKIRSPGLREVNGKTVTEDHIQFSVQLTPEEQKKYGVKVGEGNKKVLSAQEYYDLHLRILGYPPADAELLEGELRSQTRTELKTERARLQERLDELNAKMQRTITDKEAPKVQTIEIPSTPSIPPAPVKPLKVKKVEPAKPKSTASKRKTTKKKSKKKTAKKGKKK